MFDSVEDDDSVILKEAIEAIRGRRPDSVELSRELSPFDVQVYDAVCRLYAIGNRVITWQQLHNALDNYDMASKENTLALKESIHKLGSVLVTKNYWNAPDPGSTWQYQGFLVSATILNTNEMGVDIDVFKLLNEPFVDSSMLR